MHKDWTERLRDMKSLEVKYKGPTCRAIFVSLIAFIQFVATPSMAQQGALDVNSSTFAEVKISQLINDPYAYVDKAVTIVGAVGDVCPARGCWADVVSAEGDKVRFKVPDGELVFMAAMAGEQVTATGVFRAHHLSAEQATAWLTHLAAEQGETFDPRSHEGKLTVFQLEGDEALLDSEVHSL